jgi:hypothetical protein
MPLLAVLLFNALSPLEEMHRGIEEYLRKLPVRRRTLAAHPDLLEKDTCVAVGAGKPRLVLSYRKLDCSQYPGENVVAPRLIHPAQRERIRRMGYPFGLVPAGFETDAPKLADEVRRPQELAFGMALAQYDESVIERSTEDTSKIEAYLMGLIPEAATARERDLREKGAANVAKAWHEEVVGKLPEYRGPLRVRRRPHSETAAYRATEIVFDALPGVIGQGVLLEAKAEAGRRPLVILQHGLEGSPEVYFGQAKESKEFATYRNFAGDLLAAGFTVYCPQNPYKGDFRRLQLLAHPRGLSLFSFIEAQYRRMLDYLEGLPSVDRRRIVYYGLSYGGATALRVPVFDPRFKAIVCAGNFNDWIPKLIDPERKFSYVPTREYEMYEWRQAWVASHAELAALGLQLHKRPIPFFVERGRQDPVGIDEWVTREFARLQRHAPQPGLVRIAFFDGPHRVDGVEALPWLKGWVGLR